MTPLLRLDSVARHFGGVHAIKDLSLGVNEGEVFGLIGPNGAGKTTAFNVINGIFKPSAGRITFDGHDIASRRPSEIVRLGLARTFQHTNVFAKASVLENVTRGAHVRSSVGTLDGLFNTRAARDAQLHARQRAMELLELLSLGSSANEPAGSLSYGNQRRLGVAIALATGPKLLMMDEPVAGLNPEESAAFADVIRRIVAQRGVTVVLVEHHMRLVMNVCDRIAVLDYGLKIAEGPPAQIQSNDAVIAAYLGTADDELA